MNHADVKRQLADYLEGDLGLNERARLDAHLSECAECASEVDEMRQTIRLLQMLPEPEQPPMVAANVMRRIRAGETEPNAWQRIFRRLSGVLEPSFVLPASAVAVAALVTLLVRDPAMFDTWRVDGVGAEAGFAAQVGSESSFAGLGTDPNAAYPRSAASLAPPAAKSPDAEARRIQDRARAFASQHRGETLPSQGPVQYRFQWRTSVTGTEDRRDPAVPASSFASRDPLRLAAANPGGGARRVAQPVPATASGRIDSNASDPRDEWLARGFADPVGFAAFIASKNLAEQELWVARLAERAEARGLLDDFVQQLRSSGDVSAAILSDDFIAQAGPPRDLQAEAISLGRFLEGTSNGFAPGEGAVDARGATSERATPMTMER